MNGFAAATSAATESAVPFPPRGTRDPAKSRHTAAGSSGRTSTPAAGRRTPGRNAWASAVLPIPRDPYTTSAGAGPRSHSSRARSSGSRSSSSTPGTARAVALGRYRPSSSRPATISEGLARSSAARAFTATRRSPHRTPSDPTPPTNSPPPAPFRAPPPPPRPPARAERADGPGHVAPPDARRVRDPLLRRLPDRVPRVPQREEMEQDPLPGGEADHDSHEAGHFI